MYTVMDPSSGTLSHWSPCWPAASRFLTCSRGGRIFRGRSLPRSRGRGLEALKTHSLSSSLPLLRMLLTCPPKRRHRLTWSVYDGQNPMKYDEDIIFSVLCCTREEAAKLSWDKVSTTKVHLFQNENKNRRSFKDKQVTRQLWFVITAT